MLVFLHFFVRNVSCFKIYYYISITAYSTKDNGGLCITTSKTNNGSPVSAGTLSGSNKEEVLSYTIKSTDILVGVNDIYIYRLNKISTYVRKITITRPNNLPALSASFPVTEPTPTYTYGDDINLPKLTVKADETELTQGNEGYPELALIIKG